MNATVARGLVALLILGLVRTWADEPALTIADLAEYRSALVEKPEADAPPVVVTFRDLWAHPETYQGRRVRVEGRLVRRFRQGAFGTFPPLVESWVVTPAGDPFCLVSPDPMDHTPPAPTATVRFVGTFLKHIRYQGEDVPRLAPLIVGPRPPLAIARTPAAPRASHPGRGPSSLDLTIGLAAAAIVALVLAGQHWKRPIRRPPDRNPPPTFVSNRED